MKVLLILLLFVQQPEKPDPLKFLHEARLKLLTADLVSLEMPKALIIAERHGNQKATAQELHEAILKVVEEVDRITYEVPALRRLVIISLERADSLLPAAKTGRKGGRSWVCRNSKNKLQPVEYCRSHVDSSLYLSQ